VNDRSGWIKLHRRLATHELWTAERFTRGQAWADLLMAAAHVEHQVIRAGRAITVPRGGVLTSQVALAARWGWNRKSVVTFFSLLRSLDMVADISTVRGAGIGYTLLNVKNYERFQSVPPGAAGISADISGHDERTERRTFSGHSEEGSNNVTKKGKKQRADARSPSRSSLNGHRPSRKRVDAAWGRS
jgi:hypothetical protein